MSASSKTGHLLIALAGALLGACASFIVARSMRSVFRAAALVIAATCAAELVKALRNPRFQEQFLKAQAFDPVGSAPEQFAQFLRADRAKAKEVIAKTGIRLEDAAAR